MARERRIAPKNETLVGVVEVLGGGSNLQPMDQQRKGHKTSVSDVKIIQLSIDPRIQVWHNLSNKGEDGNE